MTMNVTVTKSLPVVVRPSELASIESTIQLSSFDMGVIGVPVTALFVFNQPIQEPAETIKKVLSQTLVHYYPISGRLATGAEDAELQISCTGEGVLFVAASVCSPLPKVKFLDQSPGAKALLDELALYYDPAECNSLSNPLMMMQVTEFSCGGFVIGVTWNHAIADGYGMAKFLQALGESARGLTSPSIIPIRLDDSLVAKFVPIKSPSLLVALQQNIISLEPQDLARLDITIPSSAINRIRSEYSAASSGGQSSCTVFEVVAAVLWWCRTRAIMSNPEAPTILLFAVNVRKHVGASDGYYGNCCIGQQVMDTCGAMANRNINDVIKLIKHAKDQIPHQLMRNGVTGSNQPQVVGQQELDSKVRYGLLTLTSWRNLGFEEPDFGSGKPARVMCHRRPMVLPMPTCVCLPWKGLDGTNVLSLCVKKEHAEAFLGELSSCFT